MQNVYHVCGVEIRVTDVLPQEVIGVSNGRYVVWFWHGAEVVRIYPAPNNGLQWTASADNVVERPDESGWLANNHT